MANEREGSAAWGITLMLYPKGKRKEGGLSVLALFTQEEWEKASVWEDLDDLVLTGRKRGGNQGSRPSYLDDL